VGGGGSETHYIVGGARKYISGLEGSQAAPVCPSDIGKVYRFLNMTLEGLLYCKV
jgi:hypothetical protein